MRQQQPILAPEGARNNSDGIPVPEGAARVNQPSTYQIPVVHEDDTPNDNLLEPMPQRATPPMPCQETPTPRQLSQMPEPQPPTPVMTTTRSGRQVKPPQWLIESMLANTDFKEDPCAYKNPKHKVQANGLNMQFQMGLQWAKAVKSIWLADLRAMMTLIKQHTDLDNQMVEWA
jgi:hypothetical protein